MAVLCIGIAGTCLNQDSNNPCVRKRCNRRKDCVVIGTNLRFQICTCRQSIDLQISSRMESRANTSSAQLGFSECVCVEYVYLPR